MLAIHFHGIDVELESDSRHFTNFVSEYLSGFSHVEKGCGLSASGRIQLSGRLSSSVLFGSSVTPPTGPEWIMIARNVAVSKNSIYYQDTRFRILATMDGDAALHIVIHVPPESVRARLGRMRRLEVGGKAQFHTYQTALRYAFHFPLFVLLGWQGSFVGHGAAVRYRNKNIILIGANGAGKSTISAGLQLEDSEVHFLTDNYVLVSDKSVWPFPEPLRLDPTLISLERLPTIFEPAFRIRERHYFLPTNVALEAEPYEVVLVLVARGDSLQVTPISRAQALMAFVSTTLKLGAEFPHGSYTAFLPYLTERASGLYKMPCMDVDKAYRVIVPDINSAATVSHVARELIHYVL